MARTFDRLIRSAHRFWRAQEQERSRLARWLDRQAIGRLARRLDGRRRR